MLFSKYPNRVAEILPFYLSYLHYRCFFVCTIPGKLHKTFFFFLQLQMEKLASRHAITELMSWISLMENIIEEDQDKILSAVGSDVVQNFLQKYKVQNTSMYAFLF